MLEKGAEESKGSEKNKDSEASLQQMPEKLSHAHLYRAVTGITMGHSHFLEFYVYPVNGNAYDGHKHTYQGHSMMSYGHFHRVIGSTGPAIPLPDGSHIHELNDQVDDEPFSFKGGFYSTETGIPRHKHVFTGPTGKGIGYWPAGW